MVLINSTLINFNESIPFTNISTNCYNYQCVQSSANVIVLLLHMFGLILLGNRKSNKIFIINQTFLIRNLSVVEIYISLVYMVGDNLLVVSDWHIIHPCVSSSAISYYFGT